MSFSTRPIDSRKKKTRHQIPWHALLSVSLMIIRPLFALGKKFEERKKRELRMRKAITVGTAAIVALTVFLLVVSLLIKLGGVSLSSALSITGTPLEATNEGITNILLLGQGDETGQDLTDTIIIASIDPIASRLASDGARSKKASVALLSLPRDLYFLHADEKMEVEKGKLNALWRDERIALIRKEVAKEEAGTMALRSLADEIGVSLGIPIHHTMMVDFEAFVQVIDAIGGIDVDVPEAIHDTEYPGPNYTYETFEIAAGRQHLDGATALKYARTRHTTSDFDRSARQQQIIHAAMKQVEESGIAKRPKKILELYSIVASHIQTDIKTRQLVTLAGIAKDMEKENFLTLQLNNVNGLYGDQLWKGGLLYSPPRDLFEDEFVMLPVSIPEFPVTWKQVQLLMSLYFGKRKLYLAAPKIAVLNAGAVEGSARKLAREFIKFDFEVVEVTNVPDRKEFAESHVIVGNESQKDTAEFFGAGLKIPPEEMTEVWRSVLQDRASDITIVLGEDYEFRFFQDLFPLENKVE